MEEFKVRKIVFSSSSCVYGTPKYLPVDEKHPAGVGITNPYGRTKWFTEEIMKDLCTANQVFRSACHWFWNLIGEYRNHTDLLSVLYHTRYL